MLVADNLHQIVGEGEALSNIHCINAIILLDLLPELIHVIVGEVVVGVLLVV